MFKFKYIKMENRKSITSFFRKPKQQAILEIKDDLDETSSKEDKNGKVITTYSEWILSFENNNNTGVKEEIKTGIWILLISGLANYEELDDKYKDIKPSSRTSDISGVINLTQSDNIGGTADIGIKYTNGTIKYYSVTQWKKQLSKCICNPSASKWYKVEKSDEIEKMNERAFQEAIDYRKEKFGSVPSKKWKRTPNCPGGKLMAEFLSKKASESWNRMENKEKIKSIKHFLDLNERVTTNSDGIIYWNNKTNSIEGIYKWELEIEIENYLDSYSEGIYIYHGKPDNFILKTQTKYNNGVIEGMSSKLDPKDWRPRKSSNYLTSWDVVACDLTKIFKMTPVTL